MTKKLLGVLFVTLLFTTVAMATQVSEYCGSSVQGGPGEPVLSAFGVTCAAFTIPMGDTLTAVDILVDDEFTGAAGASTITYTYTITSGNFTPNWTAVASGSGISGAGAPSAGCATTSTTPPTNAYDCSYSPFSGISNPPTGSYGPVTLTVSDAWGAGSAGLLSGGATILNVYEYDTYSATPPPVTTPEPASLLMIGGGLVGLAILSRRKRRA